MQNRVRIVELPPCIRGRHLLQPCKSRKLPENLSSATIKQRWRIYVNTVSLLLMSNILILCFNLYHAAPYSKSRKHVTYSSM